MESAEDALLAESAWRQHQTGRIAEAQEEAAAAATATEAHLIGTRMAMQDYIARLRKTTGLVWEAFLEQATAYGDGDEAGERLVRYTLAATEQQEEVLKEWGAAATDTSTDAGDGHQLLSAVSAGSWPPGASAKRPTGQCET